MDPSEEEHDTTELLDSLDKLQKKTAIRWSGLRDVIASFIGRDAAKPDAPEPSVPEAQLPTDDVPADPPPA
jgi:hypothetical protein